MATFLGYSNFNGKNGDKFSADLLYDILEQNIAGNYTVVRLYGYIRSWGYSGSGSYATFYINGENSGGFSSITANQYSEVARKDVTVYHDAVGNGTLSWSLSVDTSWTLGDASASGSLPLPTIPRTSSVTATDGYINDSTRPVSIHINTATTAFRHTLRYTFGSLSGTIADKYAYLDYGWTLPTSLYTQIPNNTSGTGTIYCDTYNGDTLIGTSAVNFTARVDENQSKPTVSSSVVSVNKTLATGYTTKDLTDSDYIFIKGVSDAQVTVSATAKNSASISSYRTVNNSKVYTSSSFSISNIEDPRFDVSATDSRGYVGYQSGNPTSVNMVDYVPLTVNPNIYRPEPTSGEVVLSVSGNYFAKSFGAQNNSLTVRYRYKESSASWDDVAYKTITATIDSTNNKYSVSLSLGTTFDYQKSYDFEVVCTDKIKSIPKTYRVSEGIPMFAMFKDHLESFGSELVNNKNGFVCIGDKIGVNIYSTEEIIIGKWIDGKPVYRKVINVGAIASEPITIAHGISNFKRRINLYGYAYRSVYDNSLSIPYAEVGNSIATKVDSTNVTITPTWNPLVTESYIVLEYIKTTD